MTFSQPNAPSGGRLTDVEFAEFLRHGSGPEEQACCDGSEGWSRYRLLRNRAQQFAGHGAGRRARLWCGKSWLRTLELHGSERHIDIRAPLSHLAFEAAFFAPHSRDIFAIGQPLKVTERTKADLP